MYIEHRSEFPWEYTNNYEGAEDENIFDDADGPSSVHDIR